MGMSSILHQCIISIAEEWPYEIQLLHYKTVHPSYKSITDAINRNKDPYYSHLHAHYIHASVKQAMG